MPLPIDTEFFKENGYILARGAISGLEFSALETKFLALANERTGESYAGINDPLLVSRISEDRNLETYLYEYNS